MNNNEMMMNMVAMMMQSQAQQQQMQMQMMMAMLGATPAPAVSTESLGWQTAKDPSTVSTVSTPNEKPSKGKDAKFPPLGEATVIGDNVTVYDGIKVRYWELGFLPSKVKYGIKCSLKDAGASWDKESGAFVFKTKKDCTAWCKAQKERASKKTA